MTVLLVGKATVKQGQRKYQNCLVELCGGYLKITCKECQVPLKGFLNLGLPTKHVYSVHSLEMVKGDELRIHYIELLRVHPFIKALPRSLLITNDQPGELLKLYQSFQEGVDDFGQGRRPGGGDCRFLVIINPFGGRRQAFKIYQKIVSPMFKDAQIPHDLVSSEYRLHAQLISNKLDRNLYKGVVVIGGDGLLHECINGLLSRKDWSSVNKIGIGVVPAGTSNAFTRALGTSDPVYSVFSIIRGVRKDFDAVAYEQGDRRFYGHLACMLGFFAGIDLGGDAWRCLGHGRIIISTLNAIIRLPTCTISLNYIDDNDGDEQVALGGGGEGEGGAPFPSFLLEKGKEGQDVQKLERPPLQYKKLFEQVKESSTIVKRVEETCCYSLLITKYDWLDINFKVSNKILPTSGLLDLFLVSKKAVGGINRRKLLKSFINGNGSFIHDNPTLCDHLRIKACQLVFKKSQHSLLDIDGEEFPYADLYMECIPRILSFYVPPF